LLTWNSRVENSLDKKEKFFSNFLGKLFLSHFVLVGLLYFVIISPIILAGSLKLKYLRNINQFNSMTVAVVGIISAVIVSYVIAHLIHVLFLKLPERKLLIVLDLVALFIITFVTSVVLLFLLHKVDIYFQGREFVSQISHKEGDLVSLSGENTCIYGKNLTNPSFGPYNGICGKSIFSTQSTYGVQRYNLTYNGLHWLMDNGGVFEVSGVLHKDVNLKNRVVGTIDLISVRKNGVNILSSSRLISQEGSASRNDSYILDRFDTQEDGFYYPPTNTQSEESTEVSNVPQQDIEPSISKTYTSSGGLNIKIYDPSDKWTPEEERIRYDEEVTKYYQNTSGNEYSVNNNTQPKVISPTVKEILQIYIDNPDNNFSEEDKTRINEYKKANSFNASNFGYFLPQKDIPDLNIRKIMYWPGKINQHWDISRQKWISDPDGVSGADISEGVYCKKWYPEFSGSLVGHAPETINTWQDLSGVIYSGTRVSIECF